MSTLPAIYLAFANDDDNHLELLDQERKEVVRALGKLETNGKIKVVERPKIDPATLIRELQDYESQLHVFHYGGHADSQTLRMAGGAAHSKGLAGLLGEAPQLKLVFLNGCSTKDQVEELMEAGVGAVIATSVDVADPMAKDFSVAFYGALAIGRTVEKAFHDARRAIATTNDGVEIKEDVVPHRGVNFGLGEPAPAGPGPVSALPVPAAEAIPWALYNKIGREDVLKWRLRRLSLPTASFCWMLTFIPLYFILQSTLFGEWLLSLGLSLAAAAGLLALASWQHLLRRPRSVQYALAVFLPLFVPAGLLWGSGQSVLWEVELHPDLLGWLGDPSIHDQGSHEDSLVFVSGGREEAIAMTTATGTVVLGARNTRKLHSAARGGLLEEDVQWYDGVNIDGSATTITGFVPDYADAINEHEGPGEATDITEGVFRCSPDVVPRTFNRLLNWLLVPSVAVCELSEPVLGFFASEAWTTPRRQGAAAP